MNTTITMKVIADDADTANADIARGFGEFDRIVKKYTRFAPDSELSILNSKSGEWVDLSPEFTDLVKYMLGLAALTDGAFDPTIIDILEAYGYSAKYDFDQKLSDPELVNKIKTLVANRPSFRDIELDVKNRKVKLVKGQRIELGGIGKGYAIDCAYKQLDNNANFLIDAGGDIRSKGQNESGQPWQVGLKHIQNDQEGYIGKVNISNAAICCSGSWARKVGNFHHLINPTTGNPDNQNLTVYTYGANAMDCDAWSTTLFLLGEDGFQLMPEHMEALIIDKSQQIHLSEKFPEVLEI